MSALSNAEWVRQYFIEVRTALRLSAVMAVFGLACAVKTGGDLGGFFGLVCSFWFVNAAGAYYRTRALLQVVEDGK